MSFFKIIRTSTVGIKETFGKFSGILTPGLNFFIPVITKVHEIPVNVHTKSFAFNVKTRDNVFAQMNLTVSYRVSDPEQAFYKVQDPSRQIHASLEDVIRSTTPKLDLDALFESKDEIQQKIDDVLVLKMKNYGYAIDDVMITEIEPDARVKDAMNEINASKRNREAALNEAEANKMRMIKEAEADAERKRLQGEGIAMLRNAIIKGYEQGIADMSAKLSITPKEAMTVTLVTQYIDALDRMAHSPSAKTIFYPNSPTAPANFLNDFRGILMQAHEANTHNPEEGVHHAPVDKDIPSASDANIERVLREIDQRTKKFD